MEVLVIGGGQAGLAAAHALELAGIDYLVADAGSAVGDSWRRRYDSLTLFTPRSISSLPGTPLGGDPDGYATKDEFADYLARYAAIHRSRIVMETRIVRLGRNGDIFKAVTEDGRTFETAAVVVATGAFQKPLLPALSATLPADTRQMHISDFQNAYSAAEGPVLVVGDGASGRDAALSLARSHSVLIAQGRQRKLFPERILGRSTWRWLQCLGLLTAAPDSLIGRRMRRVDPFPNRGNGDVALVRAGIALKPRLMSCDGHHAVFADGTRELPRTVIWATGYRDDFGWIGIAGALDAAGNALHRQGVSPVPGLYFVGRPWQRNRASGLIAGVGADAREIVATLSPLLPQASGSRDITGESS